MYAANLFFEDHNLFFHETSVQSILQGHRRGNGGPKRHSDFWDSREIGPGISNHDCQVTLDLKYYLQTHR